MSVELDTALRLLDELMEQHELSLVKLSEPLLSPANDSRQYRPSAGAPSADEQPNPASLAADLAHYRDLFTKLRFSYTEQVTKEKFLRNLVSDPPQHIDPSQNYELEQKLAELKSSLQAQKAVVNELVQQLEVRSRELAERHQTVDIETVQMQEMPELLSQLRADISSMRQEQGIIADSADGQLDLMLGLEQTVELVEERESKIALLDRQLESLTEQRSLKERALKQAQDELRSAEKTRDHTVRSAQEAQQRRRNGKGGPDEIEERGRWLRGVESTMRSLLEVEG